MRSRLALVLLGLTMATVGFAVMAVVGSNVRIFTVQGHSMEPAYSPGDLIFTSASDAGSVQPGQAIVFTAGWASEKYDRRVVHRVSAVGLLGDTPVAYTRGDANDIADPQPVELTGTVNVVRFSLAGDGFWVQFLTGATGAMLLLVLGVGMLAFLFSAGGRLARQLRRQVPGTPRISGEGEQAFPYDSRSPY